MVYYTSLSSAGLRQIFRLPEEFEGPSGELKPVGSAVKVRLEDIPPEGLTVEYTDTRLRAQDLGPQVGSVLSPPRARWQLKLLGEMVQAQASYQASLGLICSRCLAETPLELAGELDLSLPSPGPGRRRRRAARRGRAGGRLL